MISKIQDGGDGHVKNSKNCNISTTERLILTKFLWALWVPSVTVAIVKNRKTNISASVGPILKNLAL